MNAGSEEPRTSVPTSPAPSDIRLVLVGALGLFVATLFIPFSRGGLFARVLAVPVMAAVAAVVIAAPAFLFRGRRGDWKGFTVWCGKGLLVLTSVLILGHVRRAMENPDRGLEPLKDGRVSIPAFLRGERAAAPMMFDHRLVKGLERGMGAFAGATVSNMTLVSVTDEPKWLRTHVSYDSVFKSEGESIPARGHIVLYYHLTGTAVLGAVCLAADRKCAGMDKLLSEADTSVKSRLGSTEIEGILPESALCSAEPIDRPDGKRSLVQTCEYEPDLHLTFMRFDAAATIESLVAERALVR